MAGLGFLLFISGAFLYFLYEIYWFTYIRKKIEKDICKRLNLDYKKSSYRRFKKG